MAVWKNVKCPKCGKPNDRKDLSVREGQCFYCGFRMFSNLNGFVKIDLPLSDNLIHS